MNQDQTPKATLGSLWRQFLPLSLSDVTMACGDPLMTTTLAHLPDARLNLGAVGVAKALAVFFESPVIMLLHAANTLAPSAASRRALWRFMLIACSALTLLLGVFALPPVFHFMAGNVMGVRGEMAEHARTVLLLLLLWPAAIGWRRYFQGLLIRGGHARAVGNAGIMRLAIVAAVLAFGFLNSMPGAMLAGLALISGVIGEALAVTLSAWLLGAIQAPQQQTLSSLPRDLKGVWRFYWPLANSMLVVWGGRALLVALIARASDGPIALAAWPAAWGFVLVVANSTRMVQQVIIRNREHVDARLLVGFAATVGVFCSLILLFMGLTPVGMVIINAFIGKDEFLAGSVRPVILLCAGIPALIALQNAIQGFLIGDGRTARVNAATWIGTTLLLLGAAAAIKLGIAGATAAALAMLLALLGETLWLAAGLNKALFTPTASASVREELGQRAS